ncbi:two-component system response regulator KdpE [Azonexus hydrophilus]|uniref:Two-component system response regulator KdpE n=1 Tax=Azonexus hydrophilus TaxID=418702 RepID=A0ABZ2XMA8_9RHOO
MSDERPQVLVVEDEVNIRQFVRLALEAEGCAVIEAGRLADGLRRAGEGHVDLVVLDLGLPDGDGIEFIRSYRGWSEGAVLILSARVEERQKIDALDAGADDYLTKPFGVGELRARVRALLRRRQRNAGEASPVFCFGEIRVDLARRLVTRGGEEVHLTPIEFRLLTMMIAHPGQVLTQRKLLAEIWGPSYVESSHYLRVYVGHLRQKLEDDPAQPRHFLTETGIGYRFQPGP